jgi:hypothetical protein
MWSTLTPREFWQEWDMLQDTYDAQPRHLKYPEDEWIFVEKSGLIAGARVSQIWGIPSHLMLRGFT